MSTRVDQLEGFIWVNGELIKWKEANVHILTHSLHYSGAVYEGIGSYNGKVFKLEEHTERLFNSAKILNYKIPFSPNEINDVIKNIVKLNNLSNSYIRPLVWRGSESMAVGTFELSSNIMVAGFNFQRPNNDNGVSLAISKWQKAPPQCMPPQCKAAANYHMAVVAGMDALNSGCHDALMLDWRGYVAECTYSNIFFVKNKELFTPITDASLNGITKQTITQIAKDLGIKLHEVRILPHEIKDYDEVFITGTSVEIKIVNSITLEKNKIIFEDNSIGNLLKSKYLELVNA